MKVSVKNGKTSNKTTMGKRLERFGEVRIVDEANSFGLHLCHSLSQLCKFKY